MINVSGIPLNKKGGNSNIKFRVLPESTMRELGFTDHVQDRWYLCKLLLKDITINITIDKNTLEGEIEILDENFLQPYDYQYMIINRGSKISPESYPVRVHIKVQAIMKMLMDVGIIYGYKENDYI